MKQTRERSDREHRESAATLDGWKAHRAAPSKRPRLAELGVSLHVAPGCRSFSHRVHVCAILRNDVQLWIREILRVSREVGRVEPLLSKMINRCSPSSFSLADATFQEALVERVLRDPVAVAFPPNRFVQAHFWAEMVAAVRAACEKKPLEPPAADSVARPMQLRPELIAQEAQSRQILDDMGQGDELHSFWYRSFELAAVCDASTTSALDGPTQSVLVLPAATATTATAAADTAERTTASASASASASSGGSSPSSSSSTSQALSSLSSASSSSSLSALDDAKAAAASSSPSSSSSGAGQGSRVYSFRTETGCLASSIGLVLWPAAFLLAEFALDHPNLFRGKRVVELGAGLGLTAVSVATFTNPSAIIATDFDVRALENIAHNFEVNGLQERDTPFVTPPSQAQAQGEEQGDKPADSSEDPVYTSSATTNGPLSPFPHAASGVPSPSSASAALSAGSGAAAVAGSCSVHTACVDWLSPRPSQLAAFDTDVILAADTTYTNDILVPFATTLGILLRAKPNAVAYLAQAQRHPSTFLLYLDALRDEGLCIEELPTEHIRARFNYDRDTCPVALHKVTLRRTTTQ